MKVIVYVRGIPMIFNGCTYTICPYNGVLRIVRGDNTTIEAEFSPSGWSRVMVEN
jgi:hypothetical protein